MIYEQIRKHLKNNGISQRFLSEKSGVSEQVMSAILNGRRKIIIEEYFNICAALEIDPVSFYFKAKD